MIGMHCVNVTIIYLLWGFAPALLFAVHPLSVWGVAWVTGNYYATAAYFTLIAYFIIHTFPNIWGALVAMPIYAAALNSTVCPINFPFLFLFIGQPWGLTMFYPLITFLFGKKFKTGLGIRFKINNDKVIRDGLAKQLDLGRLAVMTKVVARYLYPCLYPNKLGFFDAYGSRMKERIEVWKEYHSYNKEFWAAFALCLVVFIAGLMISPIGILWFFVFISIHSQFNLTGQFYAQRYLYLANVGICIVLGTLLSPYPILLTILTTFFVIRTHLYIPVWKTMEHVWLNDLETYPENPNSWNNAAQWYLQSDKPIPGYVFNKVGYYLLKAESLDPNLWEVQMNLACFFSKMNQYGMCLEKTNRSIELLEKLGGIPDPLIRMKQQREDLINFMNQQTGVLGDQQGQSALSPPEVQNALDAGKKEENGTRTVEKGVAEAHTECSGEAGISGREEGTSVCPA